MSSGDTSNQPVGDQGAYLTYGSLVSIFVPGGSGFLVGLSHGKEALCAVAQGQAADDSEDLQRMRPPGDFTRCVFEVRHQHTYAAHQRLMALATAEGGYSSRLATALAECQKERALNQREDASVRGTPVKYGDIIQLSRPMGRLELELHADGFESLALTTAPAMKNEECGRATISPLSSTDGWLRIRPSLRTHADGERVRVHKHGELVLASDPLVLEGVATQLYLHMDSDFSFDGGELEANASLSAKTPVKLMLYRQYDPAAAGALFCGEAISLRAAQLPRGPYLQTDHAHAAGLACMASAYENVGPVVDADGNSSDEFSSTSDSSERSDVSDDDDVISGGNVGSPRNVQSVGSRRKLLLAAVGDVAELVPQAGKAPYAVYLKQPAGEETAPPSSHTYWRLEDAESDGMRGQKLLQGGQVRLRHLST